MIGSVYFSSFRSSMSKVLCWLDLEIHIMCIIYASDASPSTDVSTPQAAVHFIMNSHFCLQGIFIWNPDPWDKSTCFGISLEYLRDRPGI